MHQGFSAPMCLVAVSGSDRPCWFVAPCSSANSRYFAPYPK